MYSKKLLHRIENPLSVGFFTQKDAKAKGMRLSLGSAGEIGQGQRVCFFLLVDEEDGVIADVKFQAFGPPGLTGACESGCELLLRKNIMQARRISVSLLDKQMQDRNGKTAFPEEEGALLNLVLDAIDDATEKCMDIPVSDSYVAPPTFAQGQTLQYPNWHELRDSQKKTVLESVIDEDIRPYVELDAGGVKLIKIEGNQVTIAYSGNCTSCFSSVGSTLEAIGQIFRTKIHPDLTVIPDTSSLVLE